MAQQPGLVDGIQQQLPTRPQDAANAGQELVSLFGFRQLPVRDPYAAPVGAVLVYGNRYRGHVEIRTKDGFVSDYHSKNRCFYPLLAVYGKFSS